MRDAIAAMWLSYRDHNKPIWLKKAYNNCSSNHFGKRKYAALVKLRSYQIPFFWA